MPFKKTGKNAYEAPSGKKYTAKQIKAYHAAKRETAKQVPMKGMKSC